MAWRSTGEWLAPGLCQHRRGARLGEKSCPLRAVIGPRAALGSPRCPLGWTGGADHGTASSDLPNPHTGNKAKLRILDIFPLNRWSLQSHTHTHVTRAGCVCVWIREREEREMDTKNRRILKIRKSFSFKKLKIRSFSIFLMSRSETGGVRMLTPSKGSSPTPVFFFLLLLLFIILQH